MEGSIMHNYNIVAATEAEKYRIINIIRSTGATLTGVSGYGTGYYIQLNATSLQASAINMELSRGEAVS
jgi:hypothetical protein